MKKVYPIILVGIIVFSGIGAVGISNDDSILNKNNEPSPELVVDVYGGFGITVIIRNVGDAEATDVSAFIGVFGGTPISRNTVIRYLDDIPPGKFAIARFRYVGYGIGLFRDIPVVQVHVGCDEEKYFNTDMNAFILFNLVIFR